MRNEILTATNTKYARKGAYLPVSGNAERRTNLKQTNGINITFTNN